MDQFENTYYKKISQVLVERAIAEQKRKARRLVSHIEYEINLLRKQDNPESGIEKALRNLEENFKANKIEIT